jgi:hypothetical protein
MLGMGRDITVLREIKISKGENLISDLVSIHHLVYEWMPICEQFVNN